ncbi:hypothetical protein FOPG_19503, partial [Fusarium oxysporum f. sp. conglutinans race 2 54008]
HHASVHGLPKTSEVEKQGIYSDFVSTFAARQEDIGSETVPKEEEESYRASHF